MGYSIDSHMVEANLFTESGKWKYHVCLDYSFQTQDSWEHWDLWSQAKLALKNGTRNGVSGVILEEIPEGWMLVVLEPHGKTGHPIIVKGE